MKKPVPKVLAIHMSHRWKKIGYKKRYRQYICLFCNQPPMSNWQDYPRVRNRMAYRCPNRLTNSHNLHAL